MGGDCILLSVIVASSIPSPGGAFPGRGVILVTLAIVLATIAVLPLPLLLLALFVRRVITITVVADRVTATWTRRFWETSMSWPRPPIARIDARTMWGNVTARDGGGRTLFTVSPPHTGDVVWLAENLRRELGLLDTPS